MNNVIIMPSGITTPNRFVKYTKGLTLIKSNNITWKYFFYYTIHTIYLLFLPYINIYSHSSQ